MPEEKKTEDGEAERMTPLEIIRETFEFYSSGTEFGICSNSRACAYLNRETGNRCAVGRCLNTDRFDDMACGVFTLHDEYGFTDSDLKPQYRGQSLDFWKNLQGLHDSWAYDVVGYTERAAHRAVELHMEWFSREYCLTLHDMLDGIDFGATVAPIKLPDQE